MRRALRRPCHTVRFLDCARNDRVGRSTVRRLLSFRFFTFCHFDRSIVFSLAFAQNRGFCAKEERQRSEVARRVYAACLERSLPRRARGEISERQRRTKGYRPRRIVRFLDCARNDSVGRSTALPLLSFRRARPFCRFDQAGLKAERAEKSRRIRAATKGRIIGAVDQGGCGRISKNNAYRASMHNTR